MTYLLGVTVGPIQSNIQNSKKLKDLYNSSKIVSDMMIKVKEHLKGIDKEIEIIYPAIQHVSDNNIDLTNYIICKINNINGLENMKKSVFDKFKNGMEKSPLEEIYFMFWVVDPLKEYDETYKKLTRKLRSIKNTYEFENYFEDYKKSSTRKKCSLCGDRVREDNKSKLCKVCNYKRVYSNEFYKSVYEISIDIWKEKYKDVLVNLNYKLENLFKNTGRYYSLDTVSNIIKLLETGKPEKVREEKEINEDLKDDKIDAKVLVENLKDIKNELEEIYEIKNNIIKKPHYKYCFVQMDVDDLGKWISGKWNEEENNLKNNQIEISKALCEFACTLKKEFMDSKTKVIYAGGDDFLAVLPVETLLETLNVIEKTFRERVQDRLYESNNYKKKITYSIAVILANCKDDMALALRQNREVLEKVKERFDMAEPKKNGIGISYIVNSSKIVNMYTSKTCFKKYIDNLQHWKKAKKDISFTYIDALENEFNKMKFEDLEIMEFENIKEMMQLEFKRYLNKNKPNNNTEEFKEYFKIHTELFKSIINDNIFDKSLDFYNIINCFRIYEKLTDFDFQRDGENDEASKN